MTLWNDPNATPHGLRTEFWHRRQPRVFSREDVFGPKLYGPTTGFASLPHASSLPIEATPEHCRCGDLTLARPGVPCGRCGELP